jgi:hypothetical protein
VRYVAEVTGDPLLAVEKVDRARKVSGAVSSQSSEKTDSPSRYYAVPLGTR